VVRVLCLLPVICKDPAAIEQLHVLGEKIGCTCFFFRSESKSKTKIKDVIKGAYEEAARLNRDTMIIDTAGRLQIDDELMKELE
jgi:signal recognition particle subunit SRP54